MSDSEEQELELPLLLAEQQGEPAGAAAAHDRGVTQPARRHEGRDTAFVDAADVSYLTDNDGDGGGVIGSGGGAEADRSWRETAKLGALAIGFYFGTYTARFPLFLLPWEGKTAGLDNKVWLSLGQVLGYGLMK